MRCVYYLRGSGPLTEEQLDDELLRISQFSDDDKVFSKAEESGNESSFGYNGSRAKNYRTWQQKQNSAILKAVNDFAFQQCTEESGLEKWSIDVFECDDPVRVKNTKSYTSVTSMMQLIKNIAGGKPNNPVFPIFRKEEYYKKIVPLLETLVSGNNGNGWIDYEIELDDGSKKVLITKDFVNLLFGKDSDGNQVPPRDIQKSEMDGFLKKLELIWEQQAKLGSEVHDVFNFFFKHFFSDNLDIDKIYQKTIESDWWIKQRNDSTSEKYLNYLNYQENGEFVLLKSALEAALSISNNIKQKYKNSNPIVFPELNVLGKGNIDGHEVGILGRLDLLVMDDKGNVEVIDFKCSPRQYQDYDPAKKRTFRYQLAIYRKLIQSLNLTSEKTAYQLTVVPVQFGNFSFYNDDNSIHLESIELGTIDKKNILIDIEEDTQIARETVEGNIDIVLKDTTFDTMSNEGIIQFVQNFVKKAFPNYAKYMYADDSGPNSELVKLVKQYIEDNGTIEENAEKKGYVFYDTKKKKTYEGKTEVDIVNQITEEWRYAKNTGKNLAANIKKMLIDGQKGRGFSYKAYRTTEKNPKTSSKDWTEKILSKYATPEWRVVTDSYFSINGSDYNKEQANNAILKVLESYGIILLENQNTHLIEVLKVSNQELARREVLGGTQLSHYLLGTFLSDDIQRRDPNSLILESANGNIQLMESMAVLNCIAPFLKRNNRTIGQIMVINPEGKNSTGGLSASNKQLLYNFSRLCQLCGLQNNFKTTNESDGIKMLSYAELVSQQLQSIFEEIKNQKRNYVGLKPFANNSVAQEYVSKFEEFIGNKEELLIKLDKLREQMEEIFPSLKGSVSSQLPSFEDNYELQVYNNILQAIAQTQGFDLVQQLDNNPRFFASLQSIATKGLNGSYTDNPGTLQSANLNKMAAVTERGYQNVRISVVKFNNEIQKAIKKLKEKKGFNRLKKYTFGNQSDLYKNMYDKNAKKLGLYQFKNPFDPSESTLSEEEREFLQFAIRKLANDRYNLTLSDGTFNEEKFQQLLNENPEDVLKVPLVRADFSSIVANSGGIFNALKLYFRQFMPKNIKETLTKRVYELLDIDDENKENLKNKAKNGDIYQMVNRIQNGYNDELRDRLLVKHNTDGSTENQVDYFESNLEKLLLTSNMAKNLQKEMDKIFPVMKSVIMGLTMQGFIQNDQFVNDIQYAQDYIKNKILGLPLEDLESWGTVHSIINSLGSTASKLALAFNPIQLYQTIDGLWKDIMLCIQRPDMNPDGVTAFSVKNMKDSFFWIVKDVGHFSDKPTLGEAFNRTYGINDMDINTFEKHLSNDNAGIFNFWSLGFRFSSRPDYYNRMTIFGAQLREMGAWEAHSVDEDGNLVYDWKLDKRFNKYATGDKSDLQKYNQQKALYLSMAHEFIDEGAVGIDGVNLFKIGSDENPTPLPRALTTKQSESLKALGDKIYGYYAHEKKSMIQSYTLGAIFMQMHTYWSSKKNQYISGRGFTQQGEYRQYSETQLDENGNQVEVNYWIDENGYPTTNNTGIPYMVWKGRPQEGILLTVSHLLTDMIKGDINENGERQRGWSYAWNKNYFKNTDEYAKQLFRANLTQLGYDLFMLFFFGMLIGRALKNASNNYIKEKGNDKLGQAFMNTCLYGTVKMFNTSTDDFNWARSIFGQVVDWTPFSLGMLRRQVSNMVELIDGERDTYDALINMASATRNTRPFWDYVKINSLGRKIGQKAEEE